MKNSTTGYSLIEMLVVIAVIAALAALALPAFSIWSGSLKYKQVSWDLLSQMRLSRQLAVTENLECRVELDLVGRRYRAVQGNLPSGSTIWTAVKPWVELSPEVDWATGSTCNGTSDINVGFKPNGSADAATICIKDTSGTERYRVVVSPTSGRTRIE